MSRDIGAFRTEASARLDKIESRLDNIEARLDKVEIRVDALGPRLGSLETAVRTGFEQVRADIRKINHKLDVTAQDMLDLRGNQLGLEKRVGVLERKAGITDTA